MRDVMRRMTKQISVRNVKIGGGAKISVQTMTNTKTEDIAATVDQIKYAESFGCDIVRVSVPTPDSTKALKEIIHSVDIPVIADVHFNYKRAIEAMESGADCVRINPGNIGDFGMNEIIAAAKAHNIPLRIGINSGSLEKEILDRFKEPTSDALVESALLNIKKLEDQDFFEFKISVKSSDVETMISSYRKLSEKTQYPLHLGVTESGPVFPGTIKSAIGIGSLLADGIGDTIRVSLSGDISEEIKVGKGILKSLNLLENCVNVVSCPTCARALIDVVSISNELEMFFEKMDKKLKISVLGCVVNGPGEAREADIGIFGFKPKIAKVYLRGSKVGTFSESEAVAIVKKLAIEF